MNVGRSVIFLDGNCPFCRREVTWLMRRDRAGRLGVVDIAAPDFDAAWWGLTQDAVEARFHTMTADGRMLDGVAAFRHVYGAVGLGWLAAPTGWPVLRPIFDGLYRIFARYRVPLGNLIGRRCDDGACDVPDSGAIAPGGDVRS